VSASPSRRSRPALRWNWDTPLIVSSHSNTRLYFGAQKLYRSDDRGDSWRAVSPDLTRQLDRNKLPLQINIVASGPLWIDLPDWRGRSLEAFHRLGLGYSLSEVIGHEGPHIRVSSEICKTLRRTFAPFPG